MLEFTDWLQGFLRSKYLTHDRNNINLSFTNPIIRWSQFHFSSPLSVTNAWLVKWQNISFILALPSDPCLNRADDFLFKSYKLLLNCLWSGNFVWNCSSLHWCHCCQCPRHTLMHIDTIECSVNDTKPTSQSHNYFLHCYRYFYESLTITRPCFIMSFIFSNLLRFIDYFEPIRQHRF